MTEPANIVNSLKYYDPGHKDYSLQQQVRIRQINPSLHKTCVAVAKQSQLDTYDANRRARQKAATQIIHDRKQAAKRLHRHQGNEHI